MVLVGGDASNLRILQLVETLTCLNHSPFHGIYRELAELQQTDTVHAGPASCKARESSQYVGVAIRPVSVKWHGRIPGLLEVKSIFDVMPVHFSHALARDIQAGTAPVSHNISQLRI